MDRPRNAPLATAAALLTTISTARATSRKIPYKTSPATDPTGPTTGEIMVEKGGWWGSNEFVARSAYQHFEEPPTYGDKRIGFRVASP